MNKTSEQARFEQYRLMLIATWPESGLKRAAMASAQAALERELALTNSRDRGEPTAVMGLAA